MEQDKEDEWLATVLYGLLQGNGNYLMMLDRKELLQGLSFDITTYMMMTFMEGALRLNQIIYLRCLVISVLKTTLQ